MKCLSHDKRYKFSVSFVVTIAQVLIMSKCILDTTTVIGRTPDYHISQLPVGLCNNDIQFAPPLYENHHSETPEEVTWSIYLISVVRDVDANVTSTFWTVCSKRKKIPMFLSYYVLAFLSDFTVPLLYCSTEVFKWATNSSFPIWNHNCLKQKRKQKLYLEQLSLWRKSSNLGPFLPKGSSGTIKMSPAKVYWSNLQESSSIILY